MKIYLCYRWYCLYYLLFQNNILLRKLRIALSFKSYDMIKIFKLGGVEISEGELSALFRSEDHKNYKECGDKYIRIFLKGLTEYCRN